MSNNNEWDNIIKEKLGAFEEAPPTYMWDKIASGIPANTVKIAFYRTKVFKVTSIAASIILLLGFMWFLTDKESIYNYRDNNLSTSNKLLNVDKNEIVSFKEKNIKNSTSNRKITYKKTKQKQALVANNISKSNKEISSKTIRISSSNSDIAHQNKGAIKKHQNRALNSYSQEVANNSSNVKQDEKKILPKVIVETNAVDIADSKSISENEIGINNSTSVSTENIAVSSSVTSEVNTDIRVETKTEINNSINVVSNTQNQSNIEIDHIESNAIGASPKEIPNSDFHPKTRTFNRIGFGAHYGLESIQINDNNILSNNIDLSFNFQNLNFIMQSGVGISYSKDVRGYNLEYMRNDYLTTEMRFDSATFVVDSIGNVNIVPVNPYYTDVYDSIHHTYNATYNEIYYSLRIPLMIGYQKDFKRIGIFAKGGVFYSRVIYRQKTAIYEPDESSRMIKLNYSGSARVSNQIQYVLSAGLAYRFSRNIQFSGELMTKFYQNSLYDNPDYAKLNPWSLEGRIGLVYFL